MYDKVLHPPRFSYKTGPETLALDATTPHAIGIVTRPHAENPEFPGNFACPRKRFAALASRGCSV